jgi:glutamate dehydrogenase (NAD(P)+)
VPDLGSQVYDGMLLEDQLTGYGVLRAARAAVEFDGGTLAGLRVAIEGFGKVGGGAAKFFAREGALVVAVSTIDGTRYDPAGLDIGALLELRRQYGDAAVERYPHGRLLPREALFALPVAILVPGARPDAINAANVDTIEARYVVPAANIPYAEGTAARLSARGRVAVPDFVSNAGGVLAGVVGLRGGSAEDAFATVRERIEHNVHRVRQRAAAEGRDPVRVATEMARERLSRA